MYGYIVINQPELKFKEYDIYRSYYCGLCHVLKENYGFKGQISISYDMTFLVMLLNGLYEPGITYIQEKCAAHPVRKHQTRFSQITEYVADMDILMTYYKCLDDWEDEKKITRGIFASGLKKAAMHIMDKYPDKAQKIKEQLLRLSEIEKRNETNIDVAADPFANILGIICAIYDDEWKDMLFHMGYNLGKFIYLIDAYEDIDSDIKKNNYNVFKTHMSYDGFDDMCASILNCIMAECARNFEMLPIIEDAQILRNIIYSGVWTRFEQIRAKRNEQENKVDRSV